jgi:hypothetical protein
MRTTSSREAYRNPWIRVREDTVELADGSTGLYGVVERPDFALVIPVERGGFWLVEQYRYPLGRRSWEFPQGTWSHGNAGSNEELARTGLIAGPTDREVTESDMRVAFVPDAELRQMIRDGRFTDSPSLGAYSLLLLGEA